MPNHTITNLWYERYCECRACNEIRDGLETAYDHEDETYDEDYCGECDCSPCSCNEDESYGPEEHPLSASERLAIDNPLHSILRRGGRYWSSEVEINGLDPDEASRAANIPLESYTRKSTEDAYICATGDCTVSAEVKIGRIRDGSRWAATLAHGTYETLRTHGATCAYNAGHHVHVDATRIVDLGNDAVGVVLRSSLALANACEPALVALAATGYPNWRGHESNGHTGHLKDSPDTAERSRSAWHSSNAWAAARYGAERGGGIPTFEYRLPNGTTEQIRAHAHVAVALGLLDFGERYLDRDPDARDFVRRAEQKIRDRRSYGEADAAAILSRALHLSPDSLTALRVASSTSPASKQHQEVWRIAAAA